MKNKGIKITLRRADEMSAASAEYRIEKVTGAVTFEYPRADNINKLNTGRVGDTVSEKEASLISDRFEVITLAKPT